MQIPDDLVVSLRSARHVVVLTGAGVSADSGIPTFRDALTGLWEKFDAEDLATPEAFKRDPPLVWGWYEWRRGQAMRAQPNRGHLSIAALERRVPKFTLTTQNVDDMHERAGSSSPIHLHGSLSQPRCFACNRPHVLPPGMPDEPDGGRRLEPPRCHFCGGRVRPGVVWFGEPMPATAWKAANAAAQSCDLMFVVGTSGLVYPAASLPTLAAENGATIVQVNPAPTSLDGAADHNLLGPAGNAMVAVIEATWSA